MSVMNLKKNTSGFASTSYFKRNWTKLEKDGTPTILDSPITTHKLGYQSRCTLYLNPMELKILKLPLVYN